MDQKQAAQDLAQRAQDLAEYDPSKTAEEWLEWLKEMLVGDIPPINIIG